MLLLAGIVPREAVAIAALFGFSAANLRAKSTSRYLA